MSVRKIIQGAAGAVGASYDPYYSNVSLLLKGEGFNGSTAIFDESAAPKPITVNGNAQISTTQYKFGSSSMYFNGSGANIKTSSDSSFGLGTGDFTIEFWYFANSKLTDYQDLVAGNRTGWGANVWTISERHIQAPNVFSMFCYNYATSTYMIKGTTIISNNTWYHVAITRSGSLIRLFVNGNLEATVSTTVSLDGGGSIPISCGGIQDVNNTSINGYIDELRITKGIARYTGSITPPIASLPTTYTDPYWSNTVLLLDGETIDKSPSPKVITWNGNAQISATQSKYGFSSLYFDGGGDYLTVPPSTDMQLGSGDFTIELWMYPTASYSGVFSIGATANTDYAGFAFVNNGVVYISTSGNAWQYVAISCGTISLNVWTHIAFTRSGSSFTVWNNGNLASTTTITGSLAVNGGYSYFGVKSDVMSTGFTGYLDDLRITKGVARYTANFTPPTSLPTTATAATVASDSNYANVSLLLSGEGYNGSTSIVDTSPTPKTVTAYGDAKISTAQKKFGTSCMAFDGNGDYLSVPSDLSLILSGDFTIEFWLNPDASVTTYGGIVGKRNQSSFTDGTDWVIQIQAGGTVGFGYAASGSFYSMGTYTSGQWTHHSVIRTGTSIKTFKDGTLVTTATDSSTWNSSVALLIGRNDSTHDYKGYISDLRITKGVARYTSAFTPPTTSLPATANDSDPYRSNVSLLLKGDSFDSSPSPKQITRNGDAQISTSQFKYGSSSWYFDGNGDYLMLAANSGFTFGTGDFTIEMWANQTTSVNYAALFATTYNYNLVNSLRVTYNTTNNTLQVASASAALFTSTTALTNGVWNHIAVVRSGTTLTLYLNGVNSGSVTNSQSFVSDTPLIGQTFNNGGDANNYYLNGYIDDLRITKGIARYTSNFTPPTQLPTDATDPYWYNTVLLLNGENTDQSVSQKQVTWNGNATVSNTQVKYGTGALYFDGNGDYLTLSADNNFNFGTGDFTIEMWFYYDATTISNNDLLGSIGYYTAGKNGNFTIGIPDSTHVLFIICNGSTDTTGGVYNYIVPQISTQAWHHLAIVRNNSSVGVYVDGIKSVTTTTNSTAIIDGSVSGLKIGGNVYTPSPVYWKGYIDDLRITKGIARYTATFTPPTLPSSLIDNSIDSNYSNVSLLLKGDTFDKSLYPKTITRYDGAQISTTQKKYGSSAWYFDGAGDYLALTSSNDFVFGTGNFTVEFYIYSTNWGTGTTIFYDHRPLSTDGFYPLLYTQAGQLRYFVNSADVITGNTLLANTWYHIALVRNNSITKLFVDGIQVGSNYSDTNNYLNGTNRPVLGIRGFDVTNNAFTGYIDDLRITKGIARYDGSFTVPTKTFDTTDNSTDAYRSNVSLLLKGDLFDKSPVPKTITRNGAAQISATQSKYGTGSWYFDGSSYLSLASSSSFDLSSGTYTIEFWVYQTSRTGEGVRVITLGVNNTSNSLDVAIDTAGLVNVGVLLGGTNSISSGTAIPLNTWTHIAVSSVSPSSAALYFDGVKVSSTSALTAPTSGNLSLTIGTDTSAPTGYNVAGKLQGYIDDLRITKGIARYTANFTPPTQLPTTAAADPYWYYTSLLLNGDNIDQSPTPKALTWYGNATVSNTQNKWGTGAISFNGTTDYLSIPDSAAFDFSSNTFTIECWVYQTSNSGTAIYSYVVDKRQNGVGTYGLLLNSGVPSLMYGSGMAEAKGTTAIPLNTWTHIAASVSNGTLYMFINGVQTYTTTGLTFPVSTVPVWIGRPNTYSYYFAGYIDDLRITKGIARYTSNFTPPGPLPIS